MRESNITLDEKIKKWRESYLDSGSSPADIQEFENYLRQAIQDLTAAGLSEDEAFLIGIKRVEELPSFSERISRRKNWKTFFPESVDVEERRARKRDMVVPIVLAILAGLSTKLPNLFGISFIESPVFFLKNLSFFFMPFIAVYFIQKNSVSRQTFIAVALTFALSLLLIDLYPFLEEGQTLLLSSLHLPLFLWLITGIAFAGSEWRAVSRRMDFLRFSGEVFIYTTLLFCGIFVVSGLARVLFAAIGVYAGEEIIEHFAVPVGVASPVIAAYLVDQRKSVGENFAPVLARIFAPLLLCVMLVFLGAMVFLQRSLFLERELLIGVDLLLILVLGIVFYIISTRKETQRSQVYDWISLVLIVIALIIDTVALSAILFRLGFYGISANKLAALGENVLIFVNLAGMAVLLVRFLRSKIAFSALEKWQTVLLPVYALWLGFVALIFPLIFFFQ